MDYSSAIWGYSQRNTPDIVQAKAIGYFLGVHRFAPPVATTGNMGWLPGRYKIFKEKNILKLSVFFLISDVHNI